MPAPSPARPVPGEDRWRSHTCEISAASTAPGRRSAAPAFRSAAARRDCSADTTANGPARSARTLLAGGSWKSHAKYKGQLGSTPARYLMVIKSLFFNKTCPDMGYTSRSVPLRRRWPAGGWWPRLRAQRCTER